MNGEQIINQLKNRQHSILGEENYKKYAILLPLININGETHILFEVRSMDLRHQPGDICFPGGKVDREDRDTMHTAIRETSEELGIPERDVTDLIPLDYVVSDFGRIIYPYLGRINPNANMHPNQGEVAEIFKVPLTHFLEKKPKKYRVNIEMLPEENFPYDLIVGGENYNWRTQHVYETFFDYHGKVIWGLTARILEHFLSLLPDSTD